MEPQVKNKSFNLINLLITIAIIAFIGAVVVFAFDPIRKFQSARDAERWNDISSILNAFKEYERNYPDTDLIKRVDSLYPEDWYMIVGGDMYKGCDGQNEFSDVKIFDDHYCLDLSDLVDRGYLGEVPISPSGKIDWDKGKENGDKGTGYAFMIDEEGIVYIQSCESENTFEIKVFR